MLVKFETKSNRVKGLSFHPRRPWILSSLHNGTVQLWDYRMGLLLERFEEHDGPVRGVHFHPSQPLFVSGGDDYKVKVWNYKQKRCLFTLLGHLDYIRTVQFHHENPWIVSASDDQTIRIWNWQSRSCISVLTGHNHYVMSACFHPSEDLVLSASLDQTARVWDISGLRKKSLQPKENVSKLQMGAELLSGTDAAVKHVLEGHDRGVNWASFHPTFPLIVTGADDRQVKLWRMNDTKAWEVDTLRGHVNNVSCVLFHPKREWIVSNSEDKSIRVWDIAKRSCVHTHRRENDRFWIQAIHPHVNLMAAGHDSGMMVFKLERERPAFFAHGNALFYVKDKFVRLYEYGTQRDTPVLSLSTSESPRALHYNPAENAVLLFVSAEAGYLLFQLPKSGTVAEARRGEGLGAVFVARNKFAVLGRDNKLEIKGLDNKTSKVVTCPNPSTTGVYQAGVGTVLLRTDDKVCLFDIQQRKVLGHLPVQGLRYVYWSPDQERVALVGKHTITIADKNLQHLCLVHEAVRVKGGAWDESEAFVYTTLTHIKYCLPSGDSGTIRTLHVPVYITKVQGDILHCLDREVQNKTIYIDSTEFMFKAALHKRDFGAVKRIIKSSRISGHAIIGYLQKKGFPEVALHFVRDERTRFNLALECGKIDVAKECAGAADDKACWERLAQEALKQGRLSVVEEAYQRTESFERLSFLYLVTGQLDKLQQMQEIAKARNDPMACFHNALYLGDVAERVRMLRQSGQVSLAYLAALTHGLEDVAAELSAQLEAEGKTEVAMPHCDAPALLHPPVPLCRMEDWPLLNVAPGVFDGIDEEDAGAAGAAPGDDAGGDASKMWDEEALGLDLGDGLGGAPASGGGAGGSAGAGGAGGESELDLGGGGWGDVGLDIPDEMVADAQAAAGGPAYAAPASMPGREHTWASRNEFACDQAAAGDFDAAMSTLHLQIGAVKFDKFKPAFVTLWAAAHASMPAPSSHIPSLLLGLQTGGAVPVVCVQLADLQERKRAAHRSFNQNNLDDAAANLLHVLYHIPLLRPTQAQASAPFRAEVEKLKSECREYLLGIKLEKKRRAVIQENPTLAAELACYFTHCSLQPNHTMLALQTAMASTFKIGNVTDAGGFARRLLEGSPSQELAQRARKVLVVSEQKHSNAHQLNYDMRNPFVVCGNTLTPIFKGSPFEQCPYCSTYFSPQFKGTVCSVCGVAKVGHQASGLFTESRF